MRGCTLSWGFDNMYSLVESGNDGSINTTDTAKYGFYVIMFTSEAYKIQGNTTIDGKVITSGELVAKVKYLSSMQVETNWCLNKHLQQYIITVPARAYFIYDLKLMQ